MHWLHLISKLSDLFLQIYNTLILNQTRHSQVWFSWLPVLEGCIQKYNPPKQYWQAGPIILYEWCYYITCPYLFKISTWLTLTPDDQQHVGMWCSVYPVSSQWHLECGEWRGWCWLFLLLDTRAGEMRLGASASKRSIRRSTTQRS